MNGLGKWELTDGTESQEIGQGGWRGCRWEGWLGGAGRIVLEP